MGRARMCLKKIMVDNFAGRVYNPCAFPAFAVKAGRGKRGGFRPEAAVRRDQSGWRNRFGSHCLLKRTKGIRGACDGK